MWNRVKRIYFIFIPLSPDFQLTAQTKSCLSLYLKALTNRKASSTDRPTGKSLMVTCRILPSVLMIKSPLKVVQIKHALNRLHFVSEYTELSRK